MLNSECQRAPSVKVINHTTLRRENNESFFCSKLWPKLQLSNFRKNYLNDRQHVGVRLAGLAGRRVLESQVVRQQAVGVPRPVVVLVSGGTRPDNGRLRLAGRLLLDSGDLFGSGAGASSPEDSVLADAARTRTQARVRSRAQVQVQLGDAAVQVSDEPLLDRRVDRRCVARYYLRRVEIPADLLGQK